MDSTFEQVVKSLYGDYVDPREVWKGMPDQSALHIPGSRDKKRKALAGGLVLGTAAEGTGTFRAAQKAFAKPMIPKLPDSIHAAPKATGLKAVARSVHGGGKAEFALQAANLGVGLAAAHELFKKPPKQTTSKSFVPKPALPKFLRPKVVRALASPEVQAASQRTAKRSQAVLGAGMVAGATAGGYVATKKYHLKRVPPASATPVKPKAPTSVKKNLDFTWEGTISKVDSDKRLVFGWCSLSKVNGQPVVDLQGDYIPIEETEDAAYRYVVESRKGGDMHRRVSKFDMDEPLHTSDLVESMVITPEKLVKMGLAEDALPHGWWVGFKVNDDEQWAAVKAGQRLGFSVHGKGRRVEKSL